MKSNQNHPHEKLFPVDSIVYWIITTPVMVLAAVSIPFLNLNVCNEQAELQQTYRMSQDDIKVKDLEIENLTTKLEKLKGEKLKLHAEKLCLHKPAKDQVVIIDIPKDTLQFQYTAQKDSVQRNPTASR